MLRNKILGANGGIAFWTALGIAFTASAQNYWQQTSKPPGFSISMLIVNSNGHIFAGTYGDGLWRSRDKGDNWIQIGIGNVGLHIASLAVNRNDEIFVSTSGGMMRSPDNGENWITINTGLPAGYAISIAIDSSKGVAFAAFNNGIYRSETNGDSWQYIGRPDLYFFGLALNLHGHIFVATNCCLNVGNWLGSIFRSLDGGNSWARVYQDPPAFMGSVVQALAINARGEIFAASLWNGIVRSVDNGETWSILDSSPQKTACLAINSRGYIFVGQLEDGILYSSDRGESWTKISSGLLDTTILSIAIDANDYASSGDYSGRVFRSAQPTSVEGLADSEPAHFVLAQNYPNPFNPETQIVFNVPTHVKKQRVLIKIYDLLGRLVAVLFDREVKPGRYEVVWNGKDLLGQDLPSGTYLYRLEAGNVTIAKRMTLLR